MNTVIKLSDFRPIPCIMVDYDPEYEYQCEQVGDWEELGRPKVWFCDSIFEYMGYRFECYYDEAYGNKCIIAYEKNEHSEEYDVYYHSHIGAEYCFVKIDELACEWDYIVNEFKLTLDVTSQMRVD